MIDTMMSDTTIRTKIQRSRQGYSQVHSQIDERHIMMSDTARLAIKMFVMVRIAVLRETT